MGDSPAVILYDSNGVELSVKDGVAIPVNTPRILVAGADGSTARSLAVDSIGRIGIQNQPNFDVGLSTRASLTNQTNGAQKSQMSAWLGSTAPTVGQKDIAASLPVTMASNQPAIPVSIGPTAGEGAISEHLTDDGLPTGSSDMVVNGSVTPVAFSFTAHSDPHDIVLSGLRLVISAAFLEFNGNTFGKAGNELINGVEIKITANGGTFVETLALLTLNEDFLRLLEFSISQAGSTDVMAATLPFGGRVLLVGNSSDKVEVVINDNLTTGLRGITYLTATAYGVYEI